MLKTQAIHVDFVTRFQSTRGNQQQHIPRKVDFGQRRRRRLGLSGLEPGAPPGVLIADGQPRRVPESRGIVIIDAIVRLDRFHNIRRRGRLGWWSLPCHLGRRRRRGWRGWSRTRWRRGRDELRLVSAAGRRRDGGAEQNEIIGAHAHLKKGLLASDSAAAAYSREEPWLQDRLGSCQVHYEPGPSRGLLRNRPFDHIGSVAGRPLSLLEQLEDCPRALERVLPLAAQHLPRED